MGQAGKVRCRDLGITWSYWLSVSVLGIAAITAIIITVTSHDPAEDKGVILGCGTLFAALSMLGLLWPVLRLRERGEATFSWLSSDRQRFTGLLIPVSRVKTHLTWVGSLVLGGGALWLACSADSLEHRLKGLLAFVVYLGVIVVFVRPTARKRPGILLTERGILWHPFFNAPSFIAWDNIQQARRFSKRERYVASPAFGILVMDLAQIVTSKAARKNAAAEVARHGYHFIYNAESLLWPLKYPEDAISFYLFHPQLRHELSTGAALDRVQHHSNGLSKVPSFSDQTIQSSFDGS